ncbi:hypothetical protein HYALB_00007475 [Hymenoscyphus albidus]|uniref:N-acetyltransferase domain-containing protein n=1 Tax=Hymenoscyphus albidus TaxID=595503 RepID=A0A9N9LJX4_9HELO|nr:hypothetical protein HYALB_00007475 [Hymenoscyphus albidus]
MPTILPVQKSDLPDAANLIHTSKLALPINRLLYKNWPADAAQEEQCLNAVTGAFHNPTMESFKVVDPDTQEMVAYLVLTREKGKVVKMGDEVKTAKENTIERFDERILEWVEKSSLFLREDFEGRDHFSGFP